MCSILPWVELADRRLEPEVLVADDALLQKVAAYLDERLIGTTIQLVPAKLRAVSVVVNLQASAHSDLQRSSTTSASRCTPTSTPSSAARRRVSGRAGSSVAL